MAASTLHFVPILPGARKRPTHGTLSRGEKQMKILGNGRIFLEKGEQFPLVCPKCTGYVEFTDAPVVKGRAAEPRQSQEPYIMRNFRSFYGAC